MERRVEFRRLAVDSRLPFGWQSLDAVVFDFTDADGVVTDRRRTLCEVELKEVESQAPRLISADDRREKPGEPLARPGTRSGDPVFRTSVSGSLDAPASAVAFQHQLPDIAPASPSLVVSTRRKVSDASSSTLGSRCCSATGHGGVRARSRRPTEQTRGCFCVLPRVSVSHDWTE